MATPDRASRLNSRISDDGVGRRAGLVATHRRIIAATSGSILSSRESAAVISRRTLRYARRPLTAAVPYDSPEYSSKVGPTVPHHSSSSVTPHEYMSDAGPASPSASISGAMYPGVPATSPLASGSTLASPKSISLTTFPSLYSGCDAAARSVCSTALAGLMSQCSTFEARSSFIPRASPSDTSTLSCRGIVYMYTSLPSRITSPFRSLAPVSAPLDRTLAQWAAS
mmetsp:Transcript_21154/g.63016  ORF Transcript_21154/g.63016 Transcript_21154/m.63016 type:complete len:226 (-) Transcript_21154:146-823(-)